jgi:tetratricopeptide (TPR) repeat protein
MFEHAAGIRPLWPMIFFLPGILVGFAYLGASVRKQRERPRAIHGFLGMALALLMVAAMPMARAEPAPEHCPVPASSPGEARRLADSLYEQGAYQSAGECYWAAGDLDRANKSLAKAIGPQSEDTARHLKEQREQAKALLHKLKHGIAAIH